MKRALSLVAVLALSGCSLFSPSRPDPLAVEYIRAVQATREYTEAAIERDPDLRTDPAKKSALLDLLAAQRDYETKVVLAEVKR